MARIEYSGLDEAGNKLQALGRDCIRRIVMAGAEACKKELQARTDMAKHVRTGDMRDSFAPGKYHEGLGTAWVEVSPQGDDRRGVRNSTKAYVINHGRGKKKTAHTGDHFITGKKQQLDGIVQKAMEDEYGKCLKEAGLT